MIWKSMLVTGIGLAFVSSAYGQSCSIVAQHTLAGIKEGGVANQLQVSVLSNGAIHFRSKADVNTDGAANSYHPDEDLGQPTGASNTLCNGIGLTMPGASHVSYGTAHGACPQFLKDYARAKAAKWKAGPGVPAVDWFGIAHRKDTQTGVETPCIQGASDPFPAFFVSKTALEDESKGVCDVRRYSDANTVPSIVIPGRDLFLKDLKMRTGNAVFTYRHANNVGVDAVVGDTGPGSSVGEVSVAAAQILGGKPRTPPKSVKESYGLALPYGIDYFVLPGERIVGSAGADDVAAFGARRRQEIAFSLEACLAAVGK